MSNLYYKTTRLPTPTHSSLNSNLGVVLVIVYVVTSTVPPPQSHMRICSPGWQESVTVIMFQIVGIFRRTLTEFKDFGPVYFFSVAMAAASGSAIVLITSIGRDPNPAALAALNVACLA